MRTPSPLILVTAGVVVGLVGGVTAAASIGGGSSHRSAAPTTSPYVLPPSASPSPTVAATTSKAPPPPPVKDVASLRTRLAPPNSTWTTLPNDAGTTAKEKQLGGQKTISLAAIQFFKDSSGRVLEVVVLKSTNILQARDVVTTLVGSGVATAHTATPGAASGLLTDPDGTTTSAGGIASGNYIVLSYLAAVPPASETEALAIAQTELSDVLA